MMKERSTPAKGPACPENAGPPQRLVAPKSLVTLDAREARQMHRGMVFWLTGLSGSGKSTLAHSAEARLFAEGLNVVVLDGDAIRSGLCRDLGFSPEDRRENNRRVAELAKLFVQTGAVCLCAFISPAEQYRKDARVIIGNERFREVFVACSPEECERRDVKGFYQKARQGLIENFTGVSAGYEIPCRPDCTVCTENIPEERSIDSLLCYILSQVKK